MKRASEKRKEDWRRGWCHQRKKKNGGSSKQRGPHGRKGNSAVESNTERNHGKEKKREPGPFNKKSEKKMGVATITSKRLPYCGSASSAGWRPTDLRERNNVDRGTQKEKKVEY